MLKQPGWSSKVLPVSWAGPTDVLDLLLNSWFTLLVLVPRKGKVICWSDCEQRHDKLGTLLGTQVSISKWTLSTFSGVLQIYLPLKWAWGWTLVLELLSVDAVWLWHSSSLICCSPQSWEEYVGHCPSLACTAVFFSSSPQCSKVLPASFRRVCKPWLEILLPAPNGIRLYACVQSISASPCSVSFFPCPQTARNMTVRLTPMSPSGTHGCLGPDTKNRNK